METAVLQTPINGALAEPGLEGGLGDRGPGGQCHDQGGLAAWLPLLGAWWWRGVGWAGSDIGLLDLPFQGQQTFFKAGDLAQAQPHLQNIARGSAAHVRRSRRLLQGDKGVDTLLRGGG